MIFSGYDLSDRLFLSPYMFLVWALTSDIWVTYMLIGVPCPVTRISCPLFIFRSWKWKDRVSGALARNMFVTGVDLRHISIRGLNMLASHFKKHACLARDSILLLLLGYPRPPISDRRGQAPPLASCLRWFWTTPSVDARSRRRDVLAPSRLIHVAAGTTWSAAQPSRDMSAVRTYQKTFLYWCKLLRERTVAFKIFLILSLLLFDIVVFVEL
jgi:hypothetical protein